MSNEFIVTFRPFDKVECCFDVVAVFGNNVERNFVLSTGGKSGMDKSIVVYFIK